MLGLEDETFRGTFPFRPHYAPGNGFQMHYVDEGRGEPIVMVHGDPTWGYLWRNLIPTLSRGNRCIVPDHMGMGKSGWPAEDFPYRLEHHVANLEDLLNRLALPSMTLVLHDWGGPVGLGFATRHPERIRRLVLMNTWAFASWPGGPLPRLLEIIRSERGEKFVLERNGYVEAALRGATHYVENLTDTVLGAYRAPYPTPDSRRALLYWTRDIPVGDADPSYAEMSRIESGLHRFLGIPVMLVWGMKDPVLTEMVLRRWQRIYPHATTHEVEDASHFLQEDASDHIVSLMQQFLDAS